MVVGPVLLVLLWDVFSLGNTAGLESVAETGRGLSLQSPTNQRDVDVTPHIPFDTGPEWRDLFATRGSASPDF